MSNYIEDKVIVVTGAAGGFGQLICEKTAALGAKVVASDVNKDALDEVAKISSNILPVVADVTDREQMFALSAAAVDGNHGEPRS